MKQVRQSPEALRDLDEIWDSLSAHSPQAAERFFDRFDTLVRLLARQQGIGLRCDDLIPGLRAIPVRGFQYIVYYKADPDCLSIVRVLHGARDIRRIFKGL